MALNFEKKESEIVNILVSIPLKLLKKKRNEFIMCSLHWMLARGEKTRKFHRMVVVTGCLAIVQHLIRQSDICEVCLCDDLRAKPITFSATQISATWYVVAESIRSFYTFRFCHLVWVNSILTLCNRLRFNATHTQKPIRFLLMEKNWGKLFFTLNKTHMKRNALEYPLKLLQKVWTIDSISIKMWNASSRCNL